MDIREKLGNVSFRDHFQDWDLLENLVNTNAATLCCHKIRKESWAISREEVALAEAENKPVSLGEWKAGLRKENFEWEVRGAILALWKKGFTTYISGYGEASNGLHELDFISTNPPPENLLKSIWGLTDETGVLTWTYGPSPDPHGFPEYNDGKPVWIWAIHFLETNGDAQKIKNHWDKIAESIPSLGWEQLKNNSNYAEDFRRHHMLLQE